MVTAAVERAARPAVEFTPASGRSFLALGPRSRMGARPDREPAPLVERDQELAILRGLLTRVRWGREPQLVTIVGAPGAGKSRLVAELGRLVDADPDLVTWRQGASPAGGTVLSYGAWTELVKGHAGILETDSDAVAVAKLRAAVADALGNLDGPDAADELAWLERHLLPLVSPAPVAAGDATPRAEAFAAWRRFVEALADRRPLVLVFEDVHWADDGLLDFLDDLTEQAGPVPLMIVCAGRPELLDRRPDWGGGKRNATTVSLGPLSGTGTAELLAALLHGAGLPPATETAVLEAAGGNPFFVEEYVRMLGDLELLPDHGPREAGLPVPVSVSQVITARLDTLDPGDKAMLNDAAALGERGWVGAMASVTGTARDEVEAWLRRLERRELLARVRPSAVAGETEFAFRHVLVHEVAYGQLPRARRADRHGRAAAWLETLGDDRMTDRAELVAGHYTRALEYTTASGGDTTELAGRARPALRLAGDRARSLNLPRTAARLYASALELTGPDDPARPELLLRLGEARWRTDDGRELLEQASAALLAAGRRAEAADAERMLGRLAEHQGRGEAFRSHFERALELVEGEPPSVAKGTVLAAVAGHLSIYGPDYRRAAGIGAEALELARTLGLRELEALAQQSIGQARMGMGDAGGVEDVREAAAALARLRSAWATRAANNVAVILANSGDAAGASAAAQAARQAAGQFGATPDERRTVDANAVVGLWWTGRWDLAAALVEGSFEAAAGAARVHHWEPLTRINRVRLDLAAGNLERALDDSGRALAWATEARNPQLTVMALCSRASALVAAGRTDEAEPLVDDLLERLGGNVPHSAFGSDLPRVLDAVSGPAGAAGRLRAAEALTSPWLEAAEAWAARDYGAAAAVYARIGTRPDEALARQAAGRALLAAGEPEAARAELEKARAFWAEVGAAAYLAQTEALLAEAG
jgi:predicted ATPase